MVRNCNSLDHISWRIEIICLIMSKLDLATMLHMWSNDLEGTVTPTKPHSAVGNGFVPGHMCSYKEHKLQEVCLLLNANSWQRGFILKPASIWCIFSRHYFRMMEDLDASCNKNWTMGCDHGVPCEEHMQRCSALPENEGQMPSLIWFKGKERTLIVFCLPLNQNRGGLLPLFPCSVAWRFITHTWGGKKKLHP